MALGTRQKVEQSTNSSLGVNGRWFDEYERKLTAIDGLGLSQPSRRMVNTKCKEIVNDSVPCAIGLALSSFVVNWNTFVRPSRLASSLLSTLRRPPFRLSPTSVVVAVVAVVEFTCKYPCTCAAVW